MIAFINEHRAIHGVEPICRVLPIAPSTYHAHAARRADPGRLPARAHRDAAVKIEIGRVYDENFRVYGVRKVWRQLGREGIAVARCTVARLMRTMGLQGVVRGKAPAALLPEIDAIDRVGMNRATNIFVARMLNGLMRGQTLAGWQRQTLSTHCSSGERHACTSRNVFPCDRCHSRTSSPGFREGREVWQKTEC